MRYVARLSKVVWALNLGLVVVVVSLVVLAVLPTRSSESGPDPVRTPNAGPNPVAQDSKPPAAVDSKLILARDMFGVGQAAPQEMRKPQNPPAPPRQEPPRDLPLRLLGTVVDDGGSAYAIIENTSLKSQDVYRVGDAIGAARVSRIEQNRVVLLNGGVAQTLDLIVSGTPGTPGTAVAQAPATTPAPVTPGANSGAFLRVASDAERQVNTHASAKEMSQVTALLRKVKLTPHQTDGQSDGLAVSGLGDSMLAQVAGIQDGDVVQSINGHPVPNQTKAAQVMRKARNLGSARVELKRGQESRTLTFRAGSW